MSTTNTIPDPLIPAALGVVTLPFASAKDHAAFGGEENVKDRREDLRLLAEGGWVARRSFGTPHLRAEYRYWPLPKLQEGLLEDATPSDDADEDEINRAESHRTWCEKRRTGLGVMARRPDVAATIARVAARLAMVIEDHCPSFCEYFNSGPLDSLLEYNGRLVGVIWMGPALPRSSVRRRLNELRAICSRYPLCTVVLVPSVFDRDTLFQSMRKLGLTGAVATVADAVDDKGDAGWRTTAFPRTVGGIAEVGDMVRSAPTGGFALPYLEERSTPLRGVGGAPVINDLPPKAQEIINLLVDWPVTPRRDLINMLNTSSSTFSQMLGKLRRHDYVIELRVNGKPCYALSDECISDVSARDRRDKAALLDSISVKRRYQLSEDPSWSEYAEHFWGWRVREYMGQVRHEHTVTEILGQLCKTLPRETGWEVRYMLPPPTRSYIEFSPGNRLGLMEAALEKWRGRPGTVEEVLEEDEVFVFHPDAIVQVTDGRSFRNFLLEVELTARTTRQWQERLKTYMLHSLVRQRGVLPLFVVDSVASVGRASISP